MPTMALLSENTAAAMNKTRLSALDREALAGAALAGASGYCAGCTRFCEPALAGAVPVGKVMRYLMYCRSYADRGYAQRRFRSLAPDTRAALAGLDYAAAEAACPQRMPIGRLMREAAIELA
jgi:predicted aldo/keto reductase-like oxidoreductase